MPLVAMDEMLADASRGGYAVCYCESWNLESLQAVIEGAEEMRSPIIVGFNGGFLMHPSRSKPENLGFYAGMASTVRNASVPVSLILNESDDFSQIASGINLGFNAVMVESHHLGFEEYKALVKRVVAFGKDRGVFVEGQIGELPHGWNGVQDNGVITDPRLAKLFVDETRVQALSVSIGNVHIMTKGKAAVDLEALRRIRAAVDVPLVVHGGTGFPVENAADAIGLGVTKFNFGTTLKQVYLAAMREKMAAYQEPMNPHPFLGMGGPQDILMAGRQAVKARVKELIQQYGFAGKPSRPV
ncbi:MAG: class II fructose-bisphosphate aldolase [Acidobacteria bacterium]|nr:class II fructose-bisphosphate aldolase [Acidobacteriota bacterium]MCI0625859.1 class II fructose-bisphosphate aldolase [Acidobacteriota bacterium]MCI0724881.1 class II fructose-bisphosphate aldolase [Acidobacteriota bacterium]